MCVLPRNSEKTLHHTQKSKCGGVEICETVANLPLPVFHIFANEPNFQKPSRGAYNFQYLKENNSNKF